MNEDRIIVGLDNSPIAQRTRRALGIGPAEWIKLSEKDRLDLISAFLKEEAVK
jgi:hypothetical protein